MKKATTTTKASNILLFGLWMLMLTTFSANTNGQACTFPAPAISASPSTTVCAGNPVTLSAERQIVKDLNLLQASAGLYGQDQWQTFVPTISGSLRAIEVFIYCGNSNVTFTLYNGSGIGGNIINSQVANISFCSPGKIHALNFSGVNLIAGNTYTLRMRASYPLMLGLINSSYGTYYNDLDPNVSLLRVGLNTYMSQPFNAVQWYKDATSIPGATSLTYQASVPGNYWCSAFSGTCYSTPSNVVVVTNALPAIPNITASGNTIFCSGASVALTASVPFATDVSVTSTSIPGSTQLLKRMWQSFVPVADGITTSIKVRPGEYAADTARLNIYSGLGIYGTLLSSERVIMQGGGPNNAYEYVNLPITTPLHLTPGHTYTFEIMYPGFSLLEVNSDYGTFFNGVYSYPSTRPIFQTIVKPFMNNLQWFDGDSPVPGATSSTYTATTSGNYYCKNGVSACILPASDSIVVTVNLPLVNAGDALPALCLGATTPPLGGSFSGGVTGAVWSDNGAGGTFTNNSGSTPGTTTYRVSSSAPASITLTLTTVGGSCGTATASKIIAVNPLLAPAVGITLSPSAAVCAGTTVTLTGTGADVYIWTGGVTNGVAFAPSTTTTYQLTGTDAGTGCSNFLTTTITVNPLPTGTITSSASEPVCAGTPVTLSATNLAATASYNWVGKFATLPLDNVSGTPVMALGLRKLRSAYNGPCLRLRRSSDNVEMDFGFSGNYLDIASIVSWLGGSTGYCVKLYDQTGGSFHVSNLNFPPTLVIDGMNGNPVLHFNSNQFLYHSFNIGVPSTIIYGSKQTGGIHERGLSSIDGNWFLGYSGGARAQAYYETWVTPQGTPLADDAFHIYTGAATQTNAKIYEDGNLIADKTGVFNGPTSIQLNGGNYQGSPFLQSDIDFMDVISFRNVLSDADRIFVENSIKAFYSTTGNSSLTITPFADTVCTLTLISPQGCVSTPTITVQIGNKEIVASAGNGGNISPNGTSSICPGNNQTYTITANPGYHIAEVLVDGVSSTGAISTGDYTFTNVTANHSIAATFNCNAPFISGTISPSTTVCAGTPVTLAGTGADTYTWSDGVTDGAPFTPSATTTYTLIATNESGCSGSPEWVKISTGQFHSLGIKSDGTLWSWGNNGIGQLGDGTVTNRSTPAQVGTGTNWTDIATGYNFSLGIKSDGTLWAWGDNSVGELGDPTHPNSYLPLQIGTEINWTSIAAGSQHSLGMKSDGTLWAWGQNNNGQLGNGANTFKNIPVQVGTATNWASIKAGGSHSLGIKSDGTLWAWGYNNRGQLGDGTTTNKNTPVQVGTGTNWMNMSGGGSHSLGIKSDGTLWAWGDNFVGQSGNGTTFNGSTIPVQVGTGTNWMSMSAGGSHSLGIKSDGTLWAWGYNNDGELGNGATLNRTSPALIATGTTWSGVSGGGFYSMGIKSDGSAWGWGNNGAGQIGDGTTAARLIPMPTINQAGFRVTITIKPAPTVGITVSPSATVTAGIPVTLTGTGANTYSWSGGITNGVAFTPASTTSYTVTGTGASGCTGTATQTITVNPAIIVIASDVSGCEGSSIALSGSPAGGTFSVPNPYIGPGTTYTYSYTDGDGNTTTSAPATITIKALPTSGITNSTGTTELCQGESVMLTSNPGASYLWSTGATTQSISVSFAGDYTVSVTNAYGCSSTSAATTITVSQPETWYLDADNDGHYVNSQSSCSSPGTGYNQTATTTGDCDDADNTKWQSASFYVDADGDGYTVGSATSICYGAAIPSGYSATSLGSDCDDNNPSVHTGQNWYLDADNDGHYVTSQSSCGSPGAGYNTTATQSGDCNDNDATKWQSALLYADADGDGYTIGSATSICYGAGIPSGYSAISLGSDCDDNNPSVQTTQTWYLDVDNDGHNVSSQLSCGSPGPGYNTTATMSGDCDDNDATKWQSALLYVDADGDGYTVGSAISVCYGKTIPSGYSATSLGSDCDDNNPAVHPGTVEVCGNGIDDNCNGSIDEGCIVTYTYYSDGDKDGYGRSNSSITSNNPMPPKGYAILAGDCDDKKASVHPGATEICNGIDDNCNGVIDEGVSQTYYRDADDDGYGNPGISKISCSKPKGYVTDNRDCDDGNANVSPGAVEICGNAIDDNCNEQVDENCNPCNNATDLTTTGITAGSATLNWVASLNPAGWLVQYKTTTRGAKWRDVSPDLVPSARSVTITGLDAGQTYTWRIAAKCGNTWTSYANASSFKTLKATASYRLALLPSDVVEETSLALKLYPNPSEGQFMVDLHLVEKINGNAKLQLLDITGRPILIENVTINNGVIQKKVAISSLLSSGIYTVEIIANGNSYFAKLVYEK